MGYKSGQNIGIRLMLLRDYFNTHGSKTTAVKRKELEKYLSDSGFPIERKTLYTDLELLETYFHMEIHYDPHSLFFQAFFYFTSSVRQSSNSIKHFYSAKTTLRERNRRNRERNEE
ncbi:MAG: hypothetical protein IJS17_05905 [Clostridia bacterium]|nr:hypothetical protein [Clostridia bacterium]